MSNYKDSDWFESDVKISVKFLPAVEIAIRKISGKKCKGLSFEELLDAWNFHFEYDGKGNVISLQDHGMYWSTQGKFLKAVAPYIKSGGYICYYDGTPHNVWKYIFKNGKVYKTTAKLVYGREKLI